MAISSDLLNLSVDNSAEAQAEANREMLMGRFEEAILLAAMACGPEATAQEIRTTIENRIGGRTSSAVLSTLERLAAKGWMDTGLEDEPSKKRGGRKRILYRVTPQGRDNVVRSISITADLAVLAGLVRAA